MKIQTKVGLLECFSDDPRRADFEKQAFASCQHPFIINMDYAFQTDALAIMVLGLAVSRYCIVDALSLCGCALFLQLYAALRMQSCS